MVLIQARPKTIFVMTARNSQALLKAITFIELLLVALIIGVLAGISMPQIRKTFDNLELENFTKDLYYLTQYLQVSAISQTKIYYLNINLEEAAFWPTYKEGEEIKKPQGRLGRDYKAPPGTVITTEPQNIAAVCFYPDGSKDKIAITLKNQHGKEITLSTKGTVGGIQIQ